MNTCQFHDKPLILPDNCLYSCDHCGKRGCMNCIIKHGKELTFNFMNVPEMLRRKQ